ncbi:MAG: DUF5700 domain-containing putative Zn-dependent protease [Acidobacteriota bacterium]
MAPNARPAVEWMGAFGEGFAMLAAAGGPQIHPHAVSTPEERARWDRDAANFARDLAELDKFFLDIIGGKWKTREEIYQAGLAFFGEQGPWYTVGYRISVAVELHAGRAVLLECMMEPRRLLSEYNRAAVACNRSGGDQLPLWSPELLQVIVPVP